MEFTGIIGTAASFFTAFSLIPQLIRLYREKKPQDISLTMMLVLFVGLVLWIIYGVLIEDWIIVISNSFSVTINVITIVLGVKYRKRDALSG